jgi:hypothetical protein
MRRIPAMFAVRCVLVLMLSAPVCAQEPVAVSKNYVARAQDFLHAMYPSLNDKKYVQSVEGWVEYDESEAPLRRFTLYIGEGIKGQYYRVLGGYVGLVRPKDFHPGYQFFKQFLTAGFNFDKHDRLVHFSAEGLAIKSAEARGEYFDYLKSHPDLTQAETNGQLRNAGCKYGPDDEQAFTKHLPLGVLERFLGPIEVVSVKPVEMVTSDSGVVQEVDWSVTVQTTRSDGTKLQYGLLFDSFNGDLIGLDTLPLFRVPDDSK